MGYLPNTASSISVQTIVYTPLSHPVLTFIYDTTQTYSAFKQEVVEAIYEQSSLDKLLLTIHPQRLTGYKLLFGGKRAFIVKPTWKSENVVDGCLDINVMLRRRDGGMVPDTDVSVLRTLEETYTRKRDPRLVLEMDMVFYRVNKKEPIGPFVREDRLTKLILMEEDPEWSGYVSTVKDWDGADKDCTIPKKWVHEFELREDETVMTEWTMGKRSALVVSPKTKDGTKSAAKKNESTRAKGIANAKTTQNSPPSRRSKSSSVSQESTDLAKKSSGDKSQPKLSLREQAMALARANPKPPADPETVARIKEAREKAEKTSFTNDASTVRTSEGQEHKKPQESNKKRSATESHDAETPGTYSCNGVATDLHKTKSNDQKKGTKKAKKSGQKATKKTVVALAEPTVQAATSTISETEKNMEAKKAKSVKKKITAKPKLLSDIEHVTVAATAPTKSLQKVSAESELEAVPANDIGEGWTQKKMLRPNGKGTVTYFYSPIDGIKLRSRVEASKLIAKLNKTNGNEAEAWKLVKEDEKTEKAEKKRQRDGVEETHKTSAEKTPKSKKLKKNKEATSVQSQIEIVV